MRLSAPKFIVFLISIIIAAIALLGHFVKIPFVTQYQFWILFVSYGLLVLGNMVKGF